jgi:hypothetical protein
VPGMKIHGAFLSRLLSVFLACRTSKQDLHFIYLKPGILFSFISAPGTRDSAVGIATDYGLDDRGVGVRVPVGSRIFSSPRRPDLLWGSTNLLCSGYGGLFHGG